MAWMFEEPMRIVFMGVLIEAILLGLLVQTGRGSITVAMFAIIILFGSWLLAERMVVTSAESVEVTLNSMARDLQSNDPTRIVRYVSATAPELRQNAESRLSRVVIEEADIKGKPKITVVDDGLGRTAIADLKGLIVGDEKRGMIQDFRYLRRFILYFRWEAGQWKLYQVEEQDPI